MAKPYHDAETLRVRYHDDGMTLAEIGEYYGVSKETIRKQMVAHGIDRNSRGGHAKDAPWKNAETLRRLHWDDGLSTMQMAEKFGVNRSSLEHWFDRLGVETRSRGEALRYHYRTNVDFHTDHHGYETIRVQEYGEQKRFRHHRLLYYATHDVTLDELSGRDIHHQNECKFDNRPSNLELMGHGEHSAHHHS